MGMTSAGFIILLTIFPSLTSSEQDNIFSNRDCQFLNWKARCATDVQPLGHVILKAKVNLCSKPVDVTVTFQVNDSDSWQHTFANQDETKEVDGFSPYTMLQVLLQPMQVEQELVIQVSMVFPEDDVHKVLMRDTVSISNTRECSEKDNFPVSITVLAAFTILSLVIIILLSIYLLQRKRILGHKSLFWFNTKGKNSSVPYQEEPTTTEPLSPTSYCTTVIQNTTYRDSLYLNESLPTIDENSVLDPAFTVSNVQRPEKEIPKKKGRKHRVKKLALKSAFGMRSSRSPALHTEKGSEVCQGMLVDVQKGNVLDDNSSNDYSSFANV